MLESTEEFTVFRGGRSVGKTTSLVKWALKQTGHVLIIVRFHLSVRSIVHAITMHGGEDIIRRTQETIDFADKRIRIVAADENIERLYGQRFDKIAIDDAGCIDKMWLRSALYGLQSGSNAGPHIFLTMSRVIPDSVGEWTQTHPIQMNYIEYNYLHAMEDGLFKQEDVLFWKEHHPPEVFHQQFGPWEAVPAFLTNKTAAHVLIQEL